MLVTVRGTRPPRTIDSITELYHFTLSHYGVPALWPTLRHHCWPLASQGLDTGGLLGLTGLGFHQLYAQHRTGAHLLIFIIINKFLVLSRITNIIEPGKMSCSRTRSSDWVCPLSKTAKQKRKHRTGIIRPLLCFPLLLIEWLEPVTICHGLILACLLFAFKQRFVHRYVNRQVPL